MAGLPVLLADSPAAVRARATSPTPTAPRSCQLERSGSPLPAHRGRGWEGGTPAPLDGLRVLDLTQVLAGPT